MKNNNARQQLLTGNSASSAGAGLRIQDREASESRGYSYTPPLLLKVKEVTRLLGGVHPRTLLGLERRGLIRPVSGLLRHKLYALRDVEALVKNLSEWNP
jgi:hypothetical protein